ncbi:Transcriptional regulator, contains XRE-family HTH domain [bacterium A37T11]|nr:Transcriptional regulator, contains XRE-family HTH domain [bacterium A37T11]
MKFNVEDNLNISSHFGKQLRRFREYTGLTQQQYADYLDLTFTHINNVELGKSSVTIKSMAIISDSFGVAYFNFANPNFPIPPLEKMPAALRKYIKEVKKEKIEKKKQPRVILAPYLDKVLASDLLKTPRSAAEIAAAIEKAECTRIDPAKITGLLSIHPRNKLVRVIPPEKGRGNLYVLI